jgi:hypothetical protein
MKPFSSQFGACSTWRRDTCRSWTEIATRYGTSVQRGTFCGSQTLSHFGRNTCASNPMVRSPTWQANSRSSNQQFVGLYEGPLFLAVFTGARQLVHILSQINPLLSLPFCFIKTHEISSKWSLPCLHFHMPCVSHLPRYICTALPPLVFSVSQSVFCRYYERRSKHILICKTPTSSTRAEHLQRTRLRPPK